MDTGDDRVNEELEFMTVEEDAADAVHNANPAAHGHTSPFRQSKHPIAAFFHILFKALALFVFFFSNLFSDSFVFVFVLCILLLVCDFWTVKNITGRLLVGLRWWSYVKEDGTNEWVFESLEDMAEISPGDSTIFWTAMYVTPLIWGAFFVIELLRFEFQWLLIVIVALVMNGANIIGYVKCSQDAKQKMQRLMEHGMLRGSMAALESSSSWLLSSIMNSTVTRRRPSHPATAEV